MKTNGSSTAQIKQFDSLNQEGAKAMNIRNKTELLNAIDNGPYVWPGGYPLYFIAADGTSLSFKAVKENLSICLEQYEDIAKYGTPSDPEWHIVTIEINYENNDLFCSHTNEKIECAYCD